MGRARVHPSAWGIEPPWQFWPPHWKAVLSAQVRPVLNAKGRTVLIADEVCECGEHVGVNVGNDSNTTLVSMGNLLASGEAVKRDV
mmetsp:Transcript_27516/g.63631  ORF Transcript_27516/g.63631 Transcript_27516/m.63631 type:complete len:86 (+) Transcript_27516:211-468(+)